jgi:hypothetical protein
VAAPAYPAVEAKEAPVKTVSASAVKTIRAWRLRMFMVEPFEEASFAGLRFDPFTIAV